MLVEVKKTVWEEAICNREVSIFDEPEYLETIASLYGTKLIYWIVYRKNKAVMGFATHTKNSSIVVPNHYSYSSFWFDQEMLVDYSFFEHLEKAISVLKEKYRYISFRLPPNIKDIRAFNIHGFRSKVNYTHIKWLKNDINYRNDVKIKLAKAKEQDFLFLYDDKVEKVLEQQLGDFDYFGYSRRTSAFYKNYFETLISKGFLKGFAVYQNQKLLASALVLVDLRKGKAYNLLISASKTNYVGDASTFLYHQMFLYLKKLDFHFLDLYGADMKGIARYKSGFKGDLQNHYTVSYGFSNKYISPAINKIKIFIKSFI